MTVAQVPGSWTWGSSGKLNFTIDPGSSPVAVSSQLASVNLPEPAVCSLYLQAAFSTFSIPQQVAYLAFNISQGVGRTVIVRQVLFTSQPAIGTPLEFTVPFVPLHSLQINAEAQLFGSSSGATETATIDVAFVLSPLTRIHHDSNAIPFGMALPGEADALDDELREDLEAEGPTVQQIMMANAEHDAGVHKPAPPVHQPSQREVLIHTIIADLERRLHRRPSKAEVRAALNRIDARAARRTERGAR